MATVKIDDKEYDKESLSENSKYQLLSLQFIDGELARLNGQIAVFQTARIAYAKALKDALAGQ